MSDLKTKINSLVARGATRAAIAYGAGLQRSELSTFLGGGNLTFSKERMLTRFADALTAALDMADVDFPGLKLDLRDAEFLSRLAAAALKVLNAQLEEKNWLCVETEKLALQFDTVFGSFS